MSFSGLQTMKKIDPVTAERVEATHDALVLIVGEQSISIPWARCSAKLAAATSKERENAELSPGGYGIHWPLLDEDLSIGGLLQR